MIEDALGCHETSNQCSQAVLSSDCRVEENLLFWKMYPQNRSAWVLLYLIQSIRAQCFRIAKMLFIIFAWILMSPSCPLLLLRDPRSRSRQCYPSTNQKCTFLDHSVKWEVVRLSFLSKLAVKSHEVDETRREQDTLPINRYVDG